MADIFTKEKRSAVMSTIRSKGNKATELRLIEIFRGAGIRGWRRHQTLPGNPDFIFRAERVAIFVDGCFWHGCPEHGRQPTSNVQYWMAKLSRNKRRDRLAVRLLRARGWRVLRVWQHELKAPTKVVNKCVRVLGGVPKPVDVSD